MKKPTITYVSNEGLATLIKGLTDYKKKGVIDPWMLDTGETIEPLDILLELQEWRKSRNN